MRRGELKLAEGERGVIVQAYPKAPDMATLETVCYLRVHDTATWLAVTVTLSRS